MEQNGMYQQVQENVQTPDFIAKTELLNPGDTTTEEQDQEEEDALDGAKEDGEDFTSGTHKKRHSNDSGRQFDTTDDFDEVFGSRREFDSWDEFTDYLEEFQAKSGTRYKPRSACRVDHVNERRIGTPIPERFVYAAIKMICVHFGASGSGRRRSYVGRGCEAFMRVSYSKGAMRITQTHLIHHNHDPVIEEDQTHQRNFRVFNFTEELDLIIVKEVLRANPFEFKNGEKEWTEAVEGLKNGDERFANITPRLVKKRTRFLLDKFVSISQGRRPPAEDEMGSILYQLDKAKKQTSDGSNSIAKGRKRRGRGRPRKVSVSDDADDDEDFNIEDLVAYTPPAQKKSKQSSSTPSSSKSQAVSSGDMSLLLSYLQRKDEEDRRLRQKEVEETRKLRQKNLEEDRKLRQREMEEDRRLRQREMDLRKEELTFQKERFEFEKTERKAHLDLLKSQLQVFEQNMVMKQQTIPILQPPQQPQPPPPPQQQQPCDRPQATEYSQFHYSIQQQ